MTWADVTLREFQDALASSAPTPGGGSAAGVALGQAAALAVMVSDLTLGNETLREGWTISEKVKTIAIPMLEEGLNLATEDSEAFDKVVDSFKLPKDTDQLKLNEGKQYGLQHSVNLKSRIVLRFQPYIFSSYCLNLQGKAIPMQHLT